MSESNSSIESSEEEASAPNVEKLRRFALGVGIALLIYVVAGGEIEDKLQTPITPLVHFVNPQVLLWIFLVAVIYSSYRYWYYGIHLAMTRKKIRKYLRSNDSTYVFAGAESSYEQSVNVNHHTKTKSMLSALYRKLPPDLPRSACIVVTHAESRDDFLKAQVAKKLERYFPGLKARNVSTTMADAEASENLWSHVSSISNVTRWLCLIEDAELYLPIFVSGFAVLALFIGRVWPWLSKLID